MANRLAAAMLLIATVMSTAVLAQGRPSNQIYDTKGRATVGKHGATAESFGNQTVVRHPTGGTTVCHHDANRTFCN